jgi:rRNA maturation RNase YbeY
MACKLNFFTEGNPPALKFLKKSIRHIISEIFTYYKINASEINLIFCDDEYLLSLNKQFLAHDYFTDILTFSHDTDPLTADIFISIERVTDNADQLEINAVTELYRVIIHGCLHLCGLDDHKPADIKEMRKMEEYFLTQMQAV